jgi:methyl-accepting chemotaxis protein
MDQNNLPYKIIKKTCKKNVEITTELKFASISSDVKKFNDFCSAKEIIINGHVPEEDLHKLRSMSHYIQCSKLHIEDSNIESFPKSSNSMSHNVINTPSFVFKQTDEPVKQVEQVNESVKTVKTVNEPVNESVGSVVQVNKSVNESVNESIETIKPVNESVKTVNEPVNESVELVNESVDESVEQTNNPHLKRFNATRFDKLESVSELSISSEEIDSEDTYEISKATRPYQVQLDTNEIKLNQSYESENIETETMSAEKADCGCFPWFSKLKKNKKTKN